MNETVQGNKVLAEIFDHQPQPAFWMKPVRDENGSITDFQYQYCNEELCRFSGLVKEQLLGKCIRSNPALVEDLKEEFINQLINVYRTGEKFEDTVYNNRLNKYYSFVRSKMWDGILTVVQDRTNEYKIIQQ